MNSTRAQRQSGLRKVDVGWRRFAKNRLAVLGLCLILFFITIAVLAPFISPYAPYRVTPNSLQPPSRDHLMGTDELGRDVYSRVLYGARASLAVGITVGIVASILGVVVGAVSGFFGGRIDDFLMRFTEFFLIIPIFLLALVVIMIFGSSLQVVIFVITLLSWPMIARLVRGEFLSLREREFVMAAKMVGEGNTRQIFAEILPNALSPVIINSSIVIARAILLEAGLSFLGLGDPTTISWGIMLQGAQQFLRSASWTSVFPGLCLSLVIFGMNAVSDGLNDVMNPLLKES